MAAQQAAAQSLVEAADLTANDFLVAARTAGTPSTADDSWVRMSATGLLLPGTVLGHVKSAKDRTLSGSFTWLGDPVDNKPMESIVIDHAVAPAVMFTIFCSMTSDTSPSTDLLEASIWNATDGEVIDYRQAPLPSTQWRGANFSPIYYVHPEGRSGGECEYQLQMKCNGALSLVGGRTDTNARSDYTQAYGFTAVAA